MLSVKQKLLCELIPLLGTMISFSVIIFNFYMLFTIPADVPSSEAAFGGAMLGAGIVIGMYQVMLFIKGLINVE